jgi:uncharacterized protein YbjQ (UPF0145 family)
LPFWIFKEKDEDRAKREAQAATVAALERGDLPPSAEKRLTEQVQSGSKFFSSTFSAKEYMLAREAGYEPLGMVMGSCFMKVGWRFFLQGAWGYTSEVTALSHAHKLARTTAVERLRQEAALLGAHGVIGVKIKRSSFNWSEDMTEFTAVGTAIRVPNSECVKATINPPFTSTLSGQEFWQLYEAGYWPTSLVMGNCSYYVQGGNQVRSAQLGFFSSMVNQELEVFSRGYSDARKIAVQRLWSDVAANGGDGAVDMDVDYTIEKYEYEMNNRTYIDMMVNFMAMGTALTARPDGKKRISTAPLMMIDLATRSKREIEFDEPLNNYVSSTYSTDDDDDDLD